MHTKRAAAHSDDSGKTTRARPEEDAVLAHTRGVAPGSRDNLEEADAKKTKMANCHEHYHSFAAAIRTRKSSNVRRETKPNRSDEYGRPSRFRVNCCYAAATPLSSTHTHNGVDSIFFHTLFLLTLNVRVRIAENRRDSSRSFDDDRILLKLFRNIYK